MDYTRQLDSLLDEIKTETGILFSVSDSDFSDEMTVARVRELRNRLASVGAREEFYRQCFLGELSEEEYTRGLHRFHINDDGERMLFLLRFLQPVEPEALSVLGELMTPGRDIRIPTDGQHIALLHEADGMTEAEIEEMASGLRDTLQAEAMSSVRIAYDRPAQRLRDIAKSYAHCYTALEIGSLYSEADSILPYHALGLGKLVYSLPAEAAREYLEDHFSDFDFASLDNETTNTIRTFFDNDLSIAETARELYIHRNTLVYRLDRFEKQSGLDIRRFDDAITCRIGMMLSGRRQQS